MRIPGSALAELLAPDGASRWGPHEENTARLLEIESYRLDLEWHDRTVDPDDAEVARERAQAKRDGIKPPVKAPVPPIAHRPKSIAEATFERYVQSLAPHQHQTAPSREAVDRGTFESRWGL